MPRLLTILVCTFVAVASALQAAEKPRIAIEPLQVEGAGLSQEREAMNNFLESELLKTKAFAIVSGSEITELMKTNRILTPGTGDQTAAIQVGKLLKASRIVWGKMSDTGGKFSFWLKMADVGTGELLFSKTAATEVNDENAKREFEKNIIIIGKDLVETATGSNADEMTLKITAVSAANVTSLDASGASDPYVSISVGDEIVGTTSFKQNKADPVWNESFECPYLGERIKFAFFDRDITKDEYIGSCTLLSPKDGTYDIVNTFKGTARKMGSFTVKFQMKKYEPVDGKPAPAKGR